MNQRICSKKAFRSLTAFAMRWVKSRLIDRPVRHCRVVIRRQKLSKQVKAGALRPAQRDRSMAEEWFPIEEEAYRIKQR
jgi:CopG family transcriptional regulator/antitoxin EndoAI